MSNAALLAANVEERRLLLSRLTQPPRVGSLVYCRRRRAPRRWLFGLVLEVNGRLAVVRRADGTRLTYRFDKLYTEASSCHPPA